MRKALIYIEQEHYKEAKDLLDVVAKIYCDEPCKTFGLVINGDCADLLGDFDVLIDVQDETLKDFDQVAVADVIACLHKDHEFDSIIIAGTHFGRMIGPRVAMKIRCGIVADVTEIVRKDGKLQLVRPAYGGRMMAAIEIIGDGPVMMTAKPGVFSHTGGAKKVTQIVEPGKLEFKCGGIRKVQTVKKSINYDICEADVLISGGGGIAKGFEALEPLAEALGGKVSASRALVDKGLISRSALVGQSGKTVRPSLYMALGIHGAIQHVVALEGADYIISVNTNASAPICSLSDIVVQGDAITFVDKMLEKIMEEQPDGTN